ncbi:electron transfer flavoprotein alpha subunit apoprotein [Marinomonas polaris DSM 16579]|uniref:Electron transfer flavoprotein subunit alpha n=1 Tax=Marinomonas polaris DSM 16579 TaxID=1122206 RepID=A0A1M4VUC6_9GAMM|nr:FAD-binding protein [Marinomonas polaris]SHE72455.1 electron transfer flavoprotein alpha subunit apoprotein [Marinomonas polaris DSM 16579]|tara:strand:+ start:7534 stop:8463 length:930 start_codon:yes stop_codon:yes gene_type:complete
MSILLIAEHDNSTLNPATLSAVTAASQLGGEITMLVVGNACQSVADEAVKVMGISKVLLADSDVYEKGLAENLSALIVELAADYSHIIAAASSTIKDTMPRVAALLDVGQLTEIVAVESVDTFKRPIYAGNAIATVQSRDAVKVITVRTSAFEKAKAEGGNANTEVVDVVFDMGVSRFVSEELVKSGRPELTAASTVISGGRGLGSAENFSLLEKVADKLVAAVGASRAAVDAGFVSNDLQVGQTGKIVAPELYIAVGISGAIQHLAGMKESKVIVAINKDGEAPIFQVADYGLVGDLFEILPELEAKL